MPTPVGAYYLVDLGIKQAATKLADNDVVEVGGIVPMAGKVKAIWVGCSKELPTTGTLAVGNSGKGISYATVNLLSAATVNLATLTAANAGYSQTLATVGKTLELDAGAMLRAVWTLTDITHDNDANDPAYSCIVVVEPNTW